MAATRVPDNWRLSAVPHHETAATALRDAAALALGMRNELELVVVCNQRSSTSLDDFQRHSLRTEFLSDGELTEVLGSLREHGLGIRAVVDEPEFFGSHVALLAPSASGRRPIVMNFASARLGPWGKTVAPALADLHRCRSTNSNAYVLALCRHKFHVAAVIRGLGAGTPGCWFFDAETGWLAGGLPPLGATVLVQPAFESASIGLDDTSPMTVTAGLDALVREVAAQFHQGVVIREFIPGREVEVPVVTSRHPHALPAVGIAIDGEADLGARFLTYDIVYRDGYSFYPYAERSSSHECDELQALAERIAEGIGLRGFGRIDFRVAPTGEAFAIDIAASPHFVRHSSFAFAADREHIAPALLPVALVGLALRGDQPSDQF